MIELYNGDAYKLIKDIPDNSIDLIVTDPPYLIEHTDGGENTRFAKSFRNMNKQLEAGFLTMGIKNDILEEFVRVMKKINIYIWCNHKQIPQYLDYFVTKHNCNFDILIWNKSNAVPTYSNKYLTDKEYCLYFRKKGYCRPASYEAAKTVFYQPINAQDKKLYEHPTIKPLNIIETLVENSSTAGQTILDPFMGSGTTGVACKIHSRNFIGIELDKHFYEISQQRINGTAENIFDKYYQPELFECV